MTEKDREQLARDHIGLAYALAYRQRTRNEELDELQGDALLGLARAVMTWDPDRGHQVLIVGAPEDLPRDPGRQALAGSAVPR